MVSQLLECLPLFGVALMAGVVEATKAEKSSLLSIINSFCSALVSSLPQIPSTVKLAFGFDCVFGGVDCGVVLLSDTASPDSVVIKVLYPFFFN